MSASRVIETELLVVGSGFAGLWAALTAHDRGTERVAIVDKGDVGRSSQSRLSAGATIYCLPHDDQDAWVRDVVEAQHWLSRQDMVADMFASSYARLRQLEEWGVEYTSDANGYLRLPSRGFRTVQMMVRPMYRDRVGGSAVVMALRAQVLRRRIARHTRLQITDLLTSDGRVRGAVAIDRTTGEPVVFSAKAVVLAVGDCSFRGNYVCTDAATGDACRLALDAGARVSHLEFLCTNTGSPDFGFEGTGIAMRFGGRFVGPEGEPFMDAYHPDCDSAEVGYVVQAMASEVDAGRAPPFRLDLRGAADERGFLRVALAHMGGFMPLNLQKLTAAGIDLFAEPQEWVPAVQTLRGGVRTGIDGASDVAGLFAAGTAQAVDPGLFNGWSSCRAMWSGERAGSAAADFVSDADPVQIDADCSAVAARAVEHLGQTGGPTADDVLARLQVLIFASDVSIRKDPARVRAALAEVEAMERDDVPRMAAPDPHELSKTHETRSMVTVARLFLLASLAREESRGDHFRIDYPQVDNAHWLRFVNLRRNGGTAGDIVIKSEPVPFEHYPFRPSATEACS